jgi:hypothetical protein
MIVHQAPGQAGGVVDRTGTGDQIKIRPPVVIIEEHRQPPISALRHMVRHIRDHDAGQAGHDRWVTPETRLFNLL